MDSVQLSLSSAAGNLLEINEKTVTRAMNSYLCSAKYLRHVVPLTMFHIVHNRIAYDSKYFTKANIKDWNYVVLNKSNSHDELDNLYAWAYGAMEALQKGCLTQLFLKIIDNNETLEYYRYTFLYCKNPPVSKPKGSNKDIIKITRDWFENFSILKVLAKLPSNAKLSVEVVLNEKPEGLILLNYVETGKSDVYDQDNQEGVKNLMHLGEISTNYHKVRAYCKIKSIQKSAAASICSSDAVEINEDDPLDQVDLIQVDDSNEPTGPNLETIADNARLNIDNALTDNISKKPKKKSTKDNENDNASMENEAIVNDVSKSRTESRVSSELPRQNNSELFTQKIISCKKKCVRKEQNKRTTLFGDTTIEVVEEENAVCTNIVPPNESLIQSAESSKSITNEESTAIAKKINKKARTIHGERMCEIKKMKATNSKELPINSFEQQIIEAAAPKVIKKPSGKTNPVEILKNITIPTNFNGDCDTLNYTSPSELFVNNEIAPKAKKYTKSHGNLAKKSTTKPINLQKDTITREIETATNYMSKRKTSTQIAESNKLISPQLENIGNSSFIDDRKNQPKRDSGQIPSDLVHTILNEAPEHTLDQLTHTDMYTDNITSLTPKKTKPKRKASASAKSGAHATKKPRLIVSRNNKKRFNYKKNINESISTKLLRNKEAESVDSTILEGDVKKMPTRNKNALVDSTQLGGSQSIEMVPVATELNAYKNIADDDCNSIISTESDMNYINNRIQFN